MTQPMCRFLQVSDGHTPQRLKPVLRLWPRGAESVDLSAASQRQRQMQSITSRNRCMLAPALCLTRGFAFD